MGKKTPQPWKFVSKSLNKMKDLYVKMYTIGYYSGFYRSLKDKSLAHGGHFDFLTKDEEK